MPWTIQFDVAVSKHGRHEQTPWAIVVHLVLDQSQAAWKSLRDVEVSRYPVLSGVYNYLLTFTCISSIRCFCQVRCCSHTQNCIMPQNTRYVVIPSEMSVEEV